MKKTLILTATHGDEGFSIPIVKQLSKQFSFDWLISNPKALKLKQRFKDADLNRSAPGNLASKQYEIKRAAELLEITKEYDQVIDIHGTTSNSGLFLILSDPNWQNIEFAKKFDLENVVLWPSLQPKGPLSQFIPNTLEIECGPKNTPETAQQLKQVLVNFFTGKKPKKQQFYIVTGNIKGKINQPMQDFEETTFQNQVFTPLLVDQYQGIKCYCLQRLQNTLEY